MLIVEEHDDLHQVLSPYDWVLVHFIGAAFPLLVLSIGCRTWFTYVIGAVGILLACYSNLSTLFKNGIIKRKNSETFGHRSLICLSLC